MTRSYLCRLAFLTLVCAPGCKQSAGPSSNVREVVAPTTQVADQGPCLQRARGAAAAIQKDTMGTPGWITVTPTYLGSHGVGSTKYALYHTSNVSADGHTEEFVVGFEIRGSRCRFVPSVAGLEDATSEFDIDDRRYMFL